MKFLSAPLYVRASVISSCVAMLFGCVLALLTVNNYPGLADENLP